MSRIQTEIQQTKPFRTLEEEVFVALQRTADRLLQGVAGTLKQHGLSPTQYNVLRILRGAGSDGLPCGEVAGRMITRDPDITRLLDRLENRGLVLRTRTPSDRRVIITRITEEGLRLLAQLDEPLEKLQISQLAHVPREKLEQLCALLEAVRDT